MTSTPEAANQNTLDSFDAARRESALRARAQATQPRRPGPRLGNLHAHSFFSFNCHGWSPSHFAACAADHGMAVAGLVDFDVLDGLAEFHHAGQLLNLRTVVNLETRVFVPEFADRVINSPGEPGIAYHMAIGFAAPPSDPWAANFLRGLRSNAERRNRDLVERVNTFMDPVRLDYDADVLPLTPSGNATERHICLAYARKAAAVCGADGLAAFWTAKLGPEAAGLDFPEGPKLINALRARTMKKGGVGYVQPGRDSFPLMADFNRFALQAGAIPTITWLDGTSPGEQAMEELADVAQRSGAAALNIIPDRNFTPGKPDQKLKNLQEVLALAARRHLPVIAGTELNALGQRFVDNWEAPELQPHATQFERGAFLLYGHTALQRAAALGYLSPWAGGHFHRVEDKNAFYEKLGRAIAADTEVRLQGVTATLSPNQILARIAG